MTNSSAFDPGAFKLQTTFFGLFFRVWAKIASVVRPFVYPQSSVFPSKQSIFLIFARGRF